MNNNIIIDLDDFHTNYNAFQKFYDSKNIPECPDLHKVSDVSELLDRLSEFILNDLATVPIYYSLRPIFIELVSRLIEKPSIELKYLTQNMIPGSLTLNSICKIVNISNELSSLLEFFIQRQNFFEKLASQLHDIDQNNLHAILLAFYRLLKSDREKFKKFLKPEVLYQILQKGDSSSVIKYLSIQCLSITLELSESVKNEMIKLNLLDVPARGYYEGDLDIDYQFLPLLEAQRLSNFTKLPKVIQHRTGSKFIIKQQDLISTVVSVCGILIPTFTSTDAQETSIVPISKSTVALQHLAENVQKSKPTMLVGKPGTGKTFLINELAKLLKKDSNSSIIKIHLNDQTDAKILLGTYTSGSKPGSFIWKNGVLTTAVKEGKWVLIEDIDKAPTEVLSILLTLLEKKELTIPSRGEVIKAANGFQLISTVRLSNDSKDFAVHDMIGLRMWDLINLPSLDNSDLMAILKFKFPLLENFLVKFINVFDKVTEIYNSKRFVSMNKGSQPRPISVRDFVKFCGRVSKILQNNGITNSEQMITNDIYDMIFQEAADCFTSSIVEHAPLNLLINEIGQQLEIATSRIQLFLNRNIPQFDEFGDILKIGRAKLNKSGLALINKSVNTTSFAKTGHSLRLMEQVGVSISMFEPVLLVGETGTGKTTVVQQIAKLVHKKLTVINVSQQTEVGDLLGGYKPVNTKVIALPIQESFEELFNRTFSLKKNAKFLSLLSKCFNRNQWKNVVRLWKEAYKMSENHLNKQVENNDNDNDDTPKKKRRLNGEDKARLLDQWNDFYTVIDNFEKQSMNIDNAFAFQFIEGSLVKAVRNGDWLLLDEINLASPETLESIADLLTETVDQRNILLSEKGDVESIKAHKDFRIFGCMNPSTDVGKKDLPPSIRSRFTEIYVHSPDNDITDLLMIIDKYIGKFAVGDEWCGNDIAQLYLEAKKLADSNLIVDGANQKPHFSIRTLTRTLIYVCDIVSIYGLRRSLYEGFCMSFLTLLDAKSEDMLKPLIEKYTIGRLKNAKSVMKQIPTDPSAHDKSYVQFRHYWMKHGPMELNPQPHYIITPFVEKNMLNLVRATSGRRFPVLIQGPTSSGKTSMISYLANITGHKFVRINNHEHTDLQEYLGTYISTDTGKLEFKEGILVEALRKGHWIVLDELNLAPTDVLEALNRLLDDNRELFIPETQELVHPHPDFMLFATQNPPGLYGGRKILSRAFRNRFLELHFDDIPQDELETILRERCQIAPTYGQKIVQVYRELSLQRQATRFMEQGNSFATLRDLFRWAQREAVGYEQLAANGYMLLAERVRREDERLVVKQVIEKVMRVKLDMSAYYHDLENSQLMQLESSVVWTKAMRRLSVLVSQALEYDEPVLLVGETGCGKTTICQLIAQFTGKSLISVNAHQNTETGDILGAQRPLRNRSDLQASLIANIKKVFEKNEISVDNKDSLESLCEKFDSITSFPESSEQEIEEIKTLRQSANILFEWNDGPLIQALKEGQFFLLDEISLADDSVLERLNSVLEPERSLLLAEKGTDDAFITAKHGFKFLATMNPGGDYGKKELSPALRNRFTEIWVPSMDDFLDVHQIVSAKLGSTIKNLADPLVLFSEWFGKKFGGGNATSGVISLRDILAWVEFINTTHAKLQDPLASLLHGASMVFIDALGTNNTAFLAENEARLIEQKQECVQVLSKMVDKDLLQYYISGFQVSIEPEVLKCGLFEIPRVPGTEAAASFNLDAPTTAANAMRVVRAMQVHKPILLEGSPGVGKTSLVSALAAATGNHLTRINLSEQTDLIDLFGSDAPAEGGEAGEFVWRDAPFLRAMQKGEWVLLDEMNLASQSVLEGLNACLDHRGEAYIPELDKTFSCHPNFLVFAAQNPQYQGGGRKGLPKSFVNRFSVVYVDMLKSEDLHLIAQHLYPEIDPDVCDEMIRFISTLEEQVVIKKLWGASGAPWEFNLRDTLRWLELVNSESITGENSPANFFDIIIAQRFRSESDRDSAKNLFIEVFGDLPEKKFSYVLGEEFLQVGQTIVLRKELIQHTIDQQLLPLQCLNRTLESLITCINQSWPLILTGPTGSGKTDLIRFVLSIVGTKVDEFSMNSEVDSMDILGGYEQVDLTRSVIGLGERLKDILLELTAINLKSEKTEPLVISQALKLLEFIDLGNCTTLNFPQLKERVESFASLVPHNGSLSEIVSDTENLSIKIRETKSVKFEWFDGLLIQAVEKGNWLVLDNANLCNPSVLDRLNSLLEPNGCLMVNECSDSTGQPRIIKPHPNFRLFLTVDPKYGELSRAMRNRGIEIFLERLQVSASNFDKESLGLTTDKYEEEQDLERTLQQLSISSGNGRPLHSFSCSNESRISSYIVLSDVIARQSGEYKEELATVLTGTLALLTKKSIASWIESVEQSSEFNSTVKEISRSIYERYVFLEQAGIFEKVSDLNSSPSDSLDRLVKANLDYTSFLALNPLLNAYILPVLSNKNDTINSSEPFYLFEVSFGVMEASLLLERLERKSANGKLSDLNFLEKSAAVAQGRNIKNAPKLKIYGLIKEVSFFLKESLMDAINKDVIFDSEHFFQELFELQILWKNLVECSHNKNESKLRVYQQLIESWISKNKDGSLNAIYLETLMRVTSSFSKNLLLTTGSSIQEIWEQFRAEYPVSEEGWMNRETVDNLSNEFDEVAGEQFYENTDTVNELRMVIVQLYEENLLESQSGFDSVLENLSKGVIKLKDISSRFLNKRLHHFKADFNILLNFIDSFSIYEDKFEFSSKSYLDLYSLAGKHTRILAAADKGLFKPYPRIFDFLFSADDKSAIKGLFTDEITSSVLDSCSLFSSLSGLDLNQSMKDISKLGSALLLNSNALLADQKSIFKKLLLDWFLQLSLLHLDSESYDMLVSIFRQGITSSDSLVELLTIIQSVEGLLSFKNTSERFLIPALLIISKETADWEDLGKAWIIFSSGCIQLFVPSSPLDPATSEYVSYDICNSKLNFDNSFKKAWADYVEVSNAIVDQIPHFNDVSVSMPRVFRPSASCDPLFDSWNSFMQSSIGSDSIQRLLEVTEEFGKTASQQIELFQANSSQFLSRLSTGFSRYSDLNDILKGYVYGLKFGFGLMQLSKLNNSKRFELSSNWAVDVIAITSPSRTIDLFTQVQEFCRLQSANSLVAEQVFVYFIRLFFAHNKAPASRSDGLNDMLQQVLQALYYRWTLRRMKQEEEESSKASLYKHGDFEVDLEEDFKLLFPDFENVMTFENEHSLAEKTAIEDTYYAIAKLYVSSFSDRDDDDLEKILDNGLELNSAMNKITKDFRYGVLNSSQLAVVISRISASLDKFRSPTKDLDFYRGFSPVESKKAGEIMERIQGSTHSLLKQWPEHATLQNIFRAASELLKFPSDTPVAKLLAKVEQVYTFISEWERYAHSKVSLKSEFDQLTNLIISWRKLELSTWRCLFDFESQTLEKNLGKWWFYLFETLIVPLLSGNSEGVVDEVNLLSAVNVFLSQATSGEFGYRLSLLKAFREHLRLFDEPSLLNAVSNIITFYEQFKSTIDLRIESGKKVLEKKIHEIILLASWKDVNIDALKQSARRSHQSLYKIVRKYRSLLAETVSPIIEQGVSQSVKLTLNSTPISSTSVCHAELSKISDAATLIFPQQRNILTIERNMSIYISGFKQQYVPNIYEFLKELLESMEQLKNETPKKLTDETKKDIAALKSQKRKLLSDTLKELRRMGLKTQVSADITKSLSSVNVILARSETFDGTSIEGSDSYFFRILDLMPRLRASVSSCADDVPLSDAQKGLAVAEGLLFSLVATRLPLLKLSSFFAKISDIWSTFEYLATTQQIAKASLVDSLRLNVENYKYFAYWLPRLCDHLIFTVKSGQELSSVSCSTDIFFNAKQRAEVFADAFKNISFYGIFTVQQATFFAEFKDFLMQLMSDLNNWKITNSKYGFIADSFMEWIISRDISFDVNSSTSLAKVHNIEDLELAFKRLTTTIIVSIQKVVELQRSDSVDVEEDNWLRNTQQRLFKYSQLLFTNRITERLEECMAITMEIEHNNETSKIASSYYFAILPFLTHYMELLLAVLNTLKDNYVENSHGSFIMASALYNLAQNGFCSPEEQQDQSESERMKDGTGLGDGEGETNNSNDVEDDEDLSEQAQQPNEDQNKDDDNDDDDAVDIEGDMAGELEDAPGEDDDDEENDLDEDEDLDEEIDDIDDLDPNAIDDKMWDEEAQDNSKEKESEKMPENSNENEDLQANEDEEDLKEDEDDKMESKEDKSSENQGEEEEEKEEGGDEDEDAEEEDVGEQEDAVTNAEENQLDPNTEEADALDLPEDMNLDSGDEEMEDEDNDSEIENVPEDLDDDVDMDTEEQKEDEQSKEDTAEDELNAENESKNDDEPEEDENENPSDNGLEKGETAEDLEDIESDEELKEGTEDKTDDQHKDDTEQNLEGVDGLEDAGEDALDLEASAQQNTGEQGEGTEAQATEEQEDIGSSGSAQQYQQAESDPTPTKDEAREQATESLKELGDAMKEFHRRRQEILDLKQDELVEQSAAQKPDEFQHLDGENTEQETQALGAASKDQIQSIDEDMAIDDEEDENAVKEENELKEEEDLKDEDIEEMKNENLDPQEQQEEADFNGQSKTAFIGERKREDDFDSDLFNKMLEDDMDLDEESELHDSAKFLEESDNLPIPLEEAREIWRKSDIATQELSAGLCEQLRLILAPTLATKLKGDYKTGKRLNMKRIIPYIASQFRKDKIWLRRTKPSKRQYQIMIAVDDSKSMAESKAVDLAFESIALVSKALTQLESGGLSIVKFGESTKVVHPFDRPFTSETGAKVFQWFDFKQTRTDIKKLCTASLDLFNDARSTSNTDLWQLEIIISDGVCEDHDTIQRLVRRAREEKIMLVFVVIDGINSSESIMDMSQISYVPDADGRMVLKVDKYLDSFPFEFYVVVHNVSELPEMLAVILRQYFSELASA